MVLTCLKRMTFACLPFIDCEICIFYYNSWWCDHQKEKPKMILYCCSWFCFACKKRTNFRHGLYSIEVVCSIFCLILILFSTIFFHSKYLFCVCFVVCFVVCFFFIVQRRRSIIYLLLLNEFNWWNSTDKNKWIHRMKQSNN